MSKSFMIGDKQVGDGSPCFIIAEAGANFHISDNPLANLIHAFKLIDIAASANADAIKFQLYKAKNLYVKNAGEADYIGMKKPIYDIIKECELPKEWLHKLKSYAETKGLIFLCTPFDKESVDALHSIDIKAFKIASYSITDIPLLEYIASKGLPIILSTGASSFDEVEQAVKAISKINKELALLQCTAKYPAPPEALNLRSITCLKKITGITGLSDHSREPYTAPIAAVTLGANIIEKHFTTDNHLPGPDHNFAILPNELTGLVRQIRFVEKALGDGNKVSLKEEDELRYFCRSSIYSTRRIIEGEVLDQSNIKVLRSGKHKKGLEPKEYNNLLGKTARCDIPDGEPITYKLTIEGE